MKTLIRTLTFGTFIGTASILSAAAVCPSTPSTTSDCNFLVTISSTGTAAVSTVNGSSPFNTAMMFSDGSNDPGGNASLVGVINNSSQALTGFTLLGSGTSAGIFDFHFNGICAYTNAAYCSTAATGYEGPTTTFSSLKSTVLFQTTQGTVNFNPTLASGSSTYFSIEDSLADISGKGGLKVSNVTFAATTATPEPAESGLIALGVSALFLLRRKVKGIA